MTFWLSTALVGALAGAIAFLVLYRKSRPQWADLPAQVGPYYCEGPLYERSHCSEAGLFQCPDCRKEQHRGSL